MTNPARLEMRGVRRSFGATKALRGVELSVGPGASWTAVASAARHRFWPDAFAFQNVRSHAKAPTSLRCAGAVQKGLAKAVEGRWDMQLSFGQTRQ